MPATPEDLFALLRERGIAYEVREHEPLFTVEESRHLRGEIPGAHCKSLYLKDRKGRQFLVVCLEHRRLDMKALERALGCARLSFGSPASLMENLGVRPGAVTPFALINDRTEPRRVQVVLDDGMMSESILNYHPLHNRATVTISREGFERFLESCGHAPQRVPFGESFGEEES